MKNQNDMIVAGAVVLVAIGVSLGFMFNKRTPDPAPEVPTVVVSDPQPTSATVALSDSLPGPGRAGRGGRAEVFDAGPISLGAAGAAGPAASTVR